jgi:hypothetical protein
MNIDNKKYVRNWRIVVYCFLGIPLVVFGLIYLGWVIPNSPALKGYIVCGVVLLILYVPFLIASLYIWFAFTGFPKYYKQRIRGDLNPGFLARTDAWAKSKFMKRSQQGQNIYYHRKDENYDLYGERATVLSIMSFASGRGLVGAVSATRAATGTGYVWDHFVIKLEPVGSNEIRILCYFFLGGKIKDPSQSSSILLSTNNMPHYYNLLMDFMQWIGYPEGPIIHTGVHEPREVL